MSKARIVQAAPKVVLEFTFEEFRAIVAAADAAAKKTNDWTISNHLMEARDLVKNEALKDRVGG